MSNDVVSPAVRLVRMANQISDFFVSQPGGQNVEGVYDHIVAFWTPKLRREIVDHLNNGGEGLTPLSRQAVERLQTKS